MDADTRETIEMIEHIRRLRKVKLKGECKNCGACCNLDMNVLAIDEGNQSVYSIMNRTSCKCRAWDEVNKRCTAYERRPGICIMYPCVPENLLEGCGYYFEEDK